MKQIFITEKKNGWLVRVMNVGDYVFKATEVYEMLAFVGKYAAGEKVKVERS